MSEQKKLCGDAITAMRAQAWEAHARSCQQCQAFIVWLETLTEEEAREYVGKHSEELTGDKTEIIRNLERENFNKSADERRGLEHKYGKVWDTQQMQADFTVDGFLAPYVVVRRKSDGKKGSLQFQHMPRYYFNWQEE